MRGVLAVVLEREALAEHRDITTTQRYADYVPGLEDAGLVDVAFARGPVLVPKSENLSALTPPLRRA